MDICLDLALKPPLDTKKTPAKFLNHEYVNVFRDFLSGSASHQDAGSETLNLHARQGPYFFQMKIDKFENPAKHRHEYKIIYLHRANKRYDNQSVKVFFDGSGSGKTVLIWIHFHSLQPPKTVLSPSVLGLKAEFPSEGTLPYCSNHTE